MVAGGELELKGGGAGGGTLDIADVQQALPPLAFETVALTLSPKAAKRARSRIRDGGRVTAKLYVSATDPSGNRTDAAEKVRLG